MAQPREDLAEAVGYQLKQTQSILRQRMDDSLREIGLTTPQYVCLEVLSRSPGASSAELARGAFVTRQTMNSLLQGLQERGLVDRADRPVNGRVLATSLTDEGRRLLTAARTRSREIESRMTSNLTVAQRAELLSLLSSCAAALED